MKTLAIVLAIGLSGCASHYRIADVNEVYQIPDDCRNREMITEWLEKQLVNKKPYTETQKEFDAKTAAVQTKIMHLRFVCSPA